MPEWTNRRDGAVVAGDPLVGRGAFGRILDLSGAG